MKILIVEDNPEMRRMIRGIAAPFAREIYECGCGGEAFTLYRKHQPDFVLMDVCLTKSDGIEAAAEIRLFDSKARILIVTGYNDDSLRKRAAKAGADGYLVKDDLHKLPAILAARAVGVV